MPRAVSDVYQDMFGEGSYAGKGIYDIDAFEAALAGRAPDSTLLSHDLFEGTFARAGFASDIEVVEEFPSRYDVSAARHHRWARGDWQLLPWILGFAGNGVDASRARNALPRIGRWKMIDNLRRTLSAPTAVLALVFGWTLPFARRACLDGVRACDASSFPASFPCFPPIPVATPRRFDVQPYSCARRGSAAGRDSVDVEPRLPRRSGLDHERRDRADAVAAIRQPSPSARMDSGGADDRRRASRCHRLCRTCRGARRRWRGNAGRARVRAQHVAGGGAFFALWVASPAVARWISLPPGAARRAAISDAETRALRRTARLTWRFFETFVTPETICCLLTISRRTRRRPWRTGRRRPTSVFISSPSSARATSVGSARPKPIERLEATLATMTRMPRFRGHFYNWYDTRDLNVLEPELRVVRR